MHTSILSLQPLKVYRAFSFLQLSVACCDLSGVPLF